MSRSFVIYINNPDEIVKQTLIEFATDLGNQAAGFNSADDQRSRLSQTNPKADAVITSVESISDVDTDAVAFLQQMHQQQPNVAVILITDGSHSLSASEADSCGVQNFLRKPIRLSDVELYLTRI